MGRGVSVLHLNREPLQATKALKSLRLVRNIGSSGPFAPQLHPLVEPQVSHFRQVPLRTMVKLPHSWQLSPS